MVVEVDTSTIVTAIIAGFAGHAAVMKWAISSAVNKLGKEIAEDYVTKSDFHEHIANCPNGKRK